MNRLFVGIVKMLYPMLSTDTGVAGRDMEGLSKAGTQSGKTYTSSMAKAQSPTWYMSVHYSKRADERSESLTRDEERKRVRWYLDKWGRFDEVGFLLQRDIDLARERIESALDTKAAPLTGLPRGNDISDKTANTAEKHMAISERMAEHIAYLEERLEEETRIFRTMDEAISQLDWQEQRVLRMKYREEKSFEQIAQRIHYSKRGVEQIAERAVDKLKLRFVVTVKK